MRRGVIAINVIVIIALGLLVLITLAIMLIQQVQKTDNTVDSCEQTYGATCMLESVCKAKKGSVLQGNNCQQAEVNEQKGGWMVVTFAKGGMVCCVT